jgi:hypothetical protein
MSVLREIQLQETIKTIKHIVDIQQYNRLISNKLLKHENYYEVYDNQMKRLIKLEEYEKCEVLKKLV